MKPSQSCLEHARDLIGFDTTSHRSNLDLIEYVAASFSRYGVESVILPGDESGKANLFATIGPADRPGIILSGHTDTVPARPAEWQSDPFIATTRKQRLYGRGSADMKGFLATVMAAVPRFQAAGLRYPVHIAFSHDEEVGCLGVRPLIEYIQKCCLPPLVCLVGEPTGMVPVLGHKGKRAMRVTLTGMSGHSSSAQGMNSIEAAAAVIGLIGEIRDERRRTQPDDPTFDPPYTTIQVGVISGGEALNMCPADCQFSFEIRTIPGQDSREIVADIEERAVGLVSGRGLGVKFDEMASFPALAVEDNQQAWDLMYPVIDRASRDPSWGGCCAVDMAQPRCVSFGTEAGLFREAGIPGMVIGPGLIDQAHQPDEYIALDQLAACETFLDTLCHCLTDDAWGRGGNAKP